MLLNCATSTVSMHVHSILLYHQHSNNKMSKRFTTPIRIICILRSQFFAPCYSSTPPYINLWKFLNITRISTTVIILNLDSTYNLIRTNLYGIFKVDYRWTIFLMTWHLYYLSIFHTFCHNAIPQKMQPKLVFGINQRWSCNRIAREEMFKKLLM